MLVVLGQDELDVERSFANLPQVQTTTFGELSAHDVLRADWLVFSDRHPADGPLGLLRDARGRRKRPSRRPKAEQGREKATKATQGARRHEGRRRGQGTAEAEAERRRTETDTGARATRRPTPMRDAMSVLIRPVVSEKSYALMDQSVYVFIVDPRATKIEVRHAVEQAFSVRVTKVNTLNRKGKATRNRRTNVKGKRPDTKRAIVTLHPDDSIDLFER